tara:strand:+ start:43 stop:807 length:765 start_codon:yes stop_codon:yes gene_type:complete
MSAELARQEPGAVAVVSQPTVIDIIGKMADSPHFSLEAVQAIKELVALQERQDELRRKAEFAAAMARIQADIPRIVQRGKIVIPAKDGKAGSATTFARLADIDVALRPLLQREGMFLTFNEPETMDGGRSVIEGQLAHSNGYSETKRMTLSLDTSGSKNNIQAAGSRMRYGRRYIVGMWFNIIEADDDVAEGAGERVLPITQKQADELNDLLAEIGGDEKARFLRWAGVAKMADVTAAKFETGMKVLLGKRGGK